MKKPVLLILILITFAVTLAIVRTFVSNNIATSGVVLSEMEQERASLETENAILSEKLYTLTSLTHISESAKTLGFSENKRNFAISAQRPVALKQ
jgi:cell division protein FtsL